MSHLSYQYSFFIFENASYSITSRCHFNINNWKSFGNRLINSFFNVFKLLSHIVNVDSFLFPKYRIVSDLERSGFEKT